MEPAHEGFESPYPTGFQIDDRLEEDRQLVALQRETQFVLDLPPVDEVAAHRRIVEARLLAAVDLGFVEREVRALHQCFNILSVVGQQRYAHRAGDFETVSVDPDRPRDFLHHGQREGFRIAAVGHGAGKDEFVSAETRDRCACGSNLAQPACHFGKQPVTDLVAEGVIDFLELVEVHPEQRQLFVRLQLREHHRQIVVEASAVEQAGHYVGAGKRLHLFGEAGVGFRCRDRVPQGAEDVERDRHHRRDQQEYGYSEDLEGYFLAHCGDDQEGNDGQEQLPDSDDRPSGVAGGDTHRIADGIAGHQQLRGGATS